MKQLLFVIFVFINLHSSAQTGDFILLKKKDRTIQTYFAGSRINFTSASGAYVEANIIAIKTDTIFLQEFIIHQAMTPLGFYVLDTSFYYDKYHYNQIKAIGKTGRRFDLGGSGAALMGGGLLLTVASGVVYLADKNKFSPGLLAASVGLFGVGYLLSRQSGKGMEIGKKYSLLYIKASDNRKG